MKKTAFILSVLFTVIMLSSCASTPISQKYPERWAKTYIGMSLDEFKQVWPEAKYGGYGQNTTEIWTIIGNSTPGGHAAMVYFTFQENKLIHFYER